MFTNNPYAQGGWYNPENPQSINGQSWTVPPVRQPSIFGALPGTGGSSATEQQLLTFRLTPAHPDVLNCSLIAPTGQPFLAVTTDYSKSPLYTYFRKGDGTVLAYIEWGHHPSVCITGIVNKTPVNQWLALSADKKQRTMYARERPFTWVPQANQICLFAVGSIVQDPMVRISRGPDCIILQLSSEAIQNSLLESSIVATVLLQSGRKID